MSEFFQPGFQALLVPFVVALVATLALERLRLSGLALLTGFVASVALVAGLTLFPVSSARKIILAGLIAGALGITLDMFPRHWRWVGRASGVAAAVAAPWVIWLALRRHAWGGLLVQGGAAAGYGLWLGLLLDPLAREPGRASAALATLGIATGCCALFGASGLLGEFGFAAGAAAAGYLCVVLATGHGFPAGHALLCTGAVLCATIGTAAVALSGVPWLALPLLALVPLMARMPLPPRWPMRLKAIAILVACAVPALGAVAVTHWMRGGMIAL